MAGEANLTRMKDIGVAADTQRLVKETVEVLGGLDVIINNAGWTRFSTFGDINDLSHDEWNKVMISNRSKLFIVWYANTDFR
jgi:NAD(P)-dependent dehydrogenase (short-subunit alcohol dehydrogenase family)